MKHWDVQKEERSTQFVNKQIELTNVADIKAILYKLVEEQAKTIMFAEVRDEYVFKTIDPALAPEERVQPKRALICALGTRHNAWRHVRCYVCFNKALCS
ncbi:hypothetical protein TUM4637_35910 [Shewanella hafniensis]|nr:hypothetical protein TUM4637_35910 [Shewanella hafniensis]